MYKNYNHQLQKIRKTTKLQKKKQYESIKRKVLLRKQTESNKKIKQKRKHIRWKFWFR